MKNEQYIMALDQGTTSSRCILFDHQGNRVSTASQEFSQHYPKPGWVEHDPMEIFASQLGVASRAMNQIGIVWQCRRTAERIDAFAKTETGKNSTARTGLIPDAYFSASKIQWILEHVDGALERAHAGQLLFGTVDTWLIWKLTGGRSHVTDVTNASRTMLFDIHKLQWDEELLAWFGIPRSMMPQVCMSSGSFGITDPTLMGGEIPIMGVAGDQQAALFGQCCFESGEVKNTYGTGCFMLMNTGARPVASRNGLITTIAVGLDGEVQYALEGSVFVGGASVQWLRDELRLFRSAEQSEDYAKAVPDTAGAYVVPAFTGLGAPHWDPYARGTIVGITRGFSREHLVRATLESIAYQTADILSAMEKDSGIGLKSLKVDGGASGAAYLAGLACGYWESRDEIRRNIQVDRVFDSLMEEKRREELLNGWKKAVNCSRGWAYRGKDD